MIVFCSLFGSLHSLLFSVYTAVDTERKHVKSEKIAKNTSSASDIGNSIHIHCRCAQFFPAKGTGSQHWPNHRYSAANSRYHQSYWLYYGEPQRCLQRYHYHGDKGGRSWSIFR